MLPWILNFMKGEYHNLSVNLSFNPIIFVVAGIFSAITVWVSIKKPFKIAATISPIEAYRGGMCAEQTAQSIRREKYRFLYEETTR